MMLQLKLEPNREDRPRYVTLVTYEQRWVPVDDEVESLRLVPVRRTYQKVTGASGEGDRFICTRVTELRWRDLKAQPAYREFLDQWKAHVKEQLARIKKGARPVEVEVVP